MASETHLILRMAHILLGLGGFCLGGIVICLPKFGRKSFWHRRLGRIYAVCMLGSAFLSVPLAFRLGNYLLFTVGILTFCWVVGGWLAIRAAKAARGEQNAQKKLTLARWHISLMGSSYIAAWTAFLITNHPFGTASLALTLFYIFGPTLIGTVMISRAAFNLYTKSPLQSAAKLAAQSGRAL